MKTLDQVRSEIANLEGLRQRWESQLQAAQDELKHLEETTGDLVLEAVLAGEADQTEEVSAKLGRAAAAVTVATKTLASMAKKRVGLEIERLEGMIAAASEELQARRDAHKAHCAERDRLLQALIDYEGGGEYIPKPPPTHEQVLSYGPVRYVIPLSRRLELPIAEQMGTIQAYRAELEHQKSLLAKM